MPGGRHRGAGGCAASRRPTDRGPGAPDRGACPGPLPAPRADTDLFGRSPRRRAQAHGAVRAHKRLGTGGGMRTVVPLILTLTLAGCATGPYRPWGYGEWTRGQGLVTIRVVPEGGCPGNKAPLGYRLGGGLGLDAEGRGVLP